MNWYLEVWKKYAVFSGRSRRREYWFFVLFNIIISVVLVMIDIAIGLGNKEAGIGVLSGIYSLAVIIPSLAVTVRRLHDTDKTGWWLLIIFVPVIGAIVMLVFMLLDSQPGENKYGPSPKAAEA